MKHILVPYDGSEQAEKAFDLALDFAQKYQAKMTVLSIARLPEPPEDEEAEAIIEDAQGKYKELFDQLKKKAESYQPLQINFEIKAGHPQNKLFITLNKMILTILLWGIVAIPFFNAGY